MTVIGRAILTDPNQRETLRFSFCLDDKQHGRERSFGVCLQSRPGVASSRHTLRHPSARPS